jgi:amidohydrolase
MSSLSTTIRFSLTYTEISDMPDHITQSVQSLGSELAETRHHLHQHPELSDCEEQTARFVTERLRALGLEVREQVGGHGVVAELKGARPGRTFALRADMDALPIEEANEVPYRSQNPGVMHACGHDGHTTTLLGTAKLLTGMRDALKGTVRFIFQPAEETVGGAKRMCEQGAMEGVEGIVALHGWPQVGIGQIGVKAGPMMASSDTFDITVKGKGAHAAYPHQSIDPIVIGAQIVTALQTISSREFDPNEPVVVTVGKFHAGTAYNVIPGSAAIAGTVRTLSREARAAAPEQVRRIAEGICAAGRATCEFTYRLGTPPVLNDPATAELIREVGNEVLGADNVVSIPHSSMGAEDFAMYLEHAPGAMFRLGLGDVSPIHTPTFNFDDRALPIGVELFSRIALRFLEGGVSG